ncbi:MAG: hypothetical protein Q9215_007250 [Flavoplaca cf. flavocitrina]
MIRSSFKGFKGGDVQPPPQSKDNRDDEEDKNLTLEEFFNKYALPDEQIAELRHRLTAEWTPIFLGKKYVKNASDDPEVKATTHV